MFDKIYVVVDYYDAGVQIFTQKQNALQSVLDIIETGEREPEDYVVVEIPLKEDSKINTGRLLEHNGGYHCMQYKRKFVLEDYVTG